MANVRELITVLGFKVQDGPIKKFERSIGNLKRTLTQIATVTVATGASLFALAKHTADIGDELGESAQKIGISTRSLQKLAFAAQVSGVSQSQLVSSFRFLNKAIVDGRENGSDMAKMFHKIGIGQKALKNLKADELFIAVADGISKVSDAAERSVIAQTIFGRAGTSLLPVFADGAKGVVDLANKFESLGGVMGEDFIKQADEFDKKWNTTTGIIGIFRNRIGMKLLPIFDKIIGRFNDWIARLTPEDIKKFDDAVQSVVDHIQQFVDIVIKAAREAKRWLDQNGGARKALELLTKAVLAFIALKLAGNIFGVVAALIQMVAQFKIATGAVGGTNTAAMGLLGTIGRLGSVIALAAAAWAGYKLATDDAFRTDFQKRIQENLAKSNQAIFAAGIQIKQMLVDVFGDIAGIQMFRVGLLSLGGVAGIVAGQWMQSWENIKNAAKRMVDDIIANLKLIGKQSIVLPIVLGPLGSLLGAAANFVGGASNPSTSIPGAPPGPTSTNSKTVDVTNNNNVSASITVNATTNAKPEDIGGAVKTALNSMWDSKMRQAIQAGQGEIA